MSGRISSPNPMEVLVSVIAPSPYPRDEEAGRKLSKMACAALADRYQGLCSGVLSELFDTRQQAFRAGPLLAYAAKVPEEMCDGYDSDLEEQDFSLPKTSACPEPCWSDSLPGHGAWPLGDILLEQEETIYRRMICNYAEARRRFQEVALQEHEREIRRLMTATVESYFVTPILMLPLRVSLSSRLGSPAVIMRVY